MTSESTLTSEAEEVFETFTHRATFAAPGLIASTASPLPVEQPHGARRALPGWLPFTLNPEPGHLDLRQWSRWLFASGAVHRVDVGAGVSWPHHQPTPSARCLYPAQISLLTPEVRETGGRTLRAGVYRYDPLHHQLIGRGRPALRALRGHLGSPLGGMFAAAAVSLDWQRTHGHYGHFGYRLALLEAGMQAAQLGIVAEALGWHVSLLWDFPDAWVNAALGMGEHERVVALVVLRRSPGMVSVPAYLPALPARGGDCPSALGTTLDALDRTTHLRLGPGRAGAAVGPPTRVTPSTLDPRTLLRTLKARHSGEPVFAPVAEPGRPALLDELLRPALAPFPVADVTPTAEVSIEALLNTGGGPQHFRLSGGARPVIHRPLKASVLEAALAEIQPDMPLAKLPLSAYLCAPIQNHSPRDYRRLQLQVGLMAQRILLLAAQHGWAGRASCSFDARRAQQTLGLDTPAAPLLQLAFGREPVARQAQGRYRLPLHP